jgi:hypothetical protein
MTSGLKLALSNSSSVYRVTQLNLIYCMRFYSESRAMALHLLSLMRHFLFYPIFELLAPSNAGLSGKVIRTREKFTHPSLELAAMPIAGHHF